MNASPKVSIGLPVYNGASLHDGVPLIYQAISSILSQTFTDFELIISDNASTDSTANICKEFSKKDKRIKYFRQETTLDGFSHFKSVLEKSNCEYFVFHSHDDFWEPTFLEKNLDILEHRKHFIVSFSKVVSLGPGNNDRFKINSHDKLIKKYYKKIRLYFREQNDISSITGSYEKKIRTCLHQRHSTLFYYGVFRTDILRKAEQTDGDPHDWAVILKSLQYGDANLINEVLYHRYVRSTSNITNLYMKGKISLRSFLFPKLTFTVWFYRNFGKKRFLRNIDYFIHLNLFVIFRIFVGIIPKFLK